MRGYGRVFPVPGILWQDEGIHGSAGWECFIAVSEVTVWYGAVPTRRGSMTRGVLGDIVGEGWFVRMGDVWCVMIGVIVLGDEGV